MIAPAVKIALFAGAAILGAGTVRALVKRAHPKKPVPRPRIVVPKTTHDIAATFTVDGVPVAAE